MIDVGCGETVQPLGSNIAFQLTDVAERAARPRAKGIASLLHAALALRIEVQDDDHVLDRV
jgi:hypothetical protein